MLNIQRLIDAGFTDEDIEVMTSTFRMIGSQLAEQVKRIENLPFSNEMVDGALDRADELMEKIDKYEKSSEFGKFSSWFR